MAGTLSSVLFLHIGPHLEPWRGEA